MTPVRSLLAVALALAAAPALAQSAPPKQYTQPYSQTIFFGDSLTDSGHFRPVLVGAIGPQAGILGKFTTNPWLVWSEYLADYYGTDGKAANQGGSNYAVGGARAGQDAVGALGFTPSMTTQVRSYLAATGGVADARALYTVWGGNNDLFAVAQGAPAQATIGSAVTAQIGAIGALQAAGARYVLVPSIPDLGLTPSARAQGALAQGQLTQLASVYNAALYGGLAASGLRVIPLDTFHLFQEVAANPGAFGFSNITGTACQPQITAQSITCQPGTYVRPDAATSYAFADGVHPSGAAHEVLADYAASVLDAPRQMAVLTHSAAVTGRARAERVAAQLSGAPMTDGKRWWADVRGDLQRYDHGDMYDGAIPAFTVGLDWHSNGMTFGAFGGYGSARQDWGDRGGSFNQSETTIGGYMGWTSVSGVWVNGQLSYSQLGLDIKRNVDLGRANRVHRADVDGSNLTAGLNAGYEFGDGALRHGPVVGVLAQQIQVDAFAETDAQLSTSLAYPEHKFDSLIGTAGWQMRFTASEQLQPYARLTFDREFEDVPREAFARLQSMPGTAPFAVPGVAFDDSYGSLALGARTRVAGLEANLGTSLTVGQDGGNNTTVFATVGGNF